MALISCPECGKQISDAAVSCPNCGYPIASPNDTQEISQDHTASLKTVTDAVGEESSPHAQNTTEKSTYNKEISIIVGIGILLIALSIIVPGMQKVTAGNVKINQLYNTSLGFGLKLGMNKSSIDKVLGSPEMAYNDYLYPDQYLYVQFDNGKLVSMYIEYPNDRWVTAGNITIGSSLDSVKKALGEPKSIEQDNEWLYYMSEGFVTGINVSKSSEKVNAIYIYNSSWASKQNP